MSLYKFDLLQRFGDERLLLCTTQMSQRGPARSPTVRAPADASGGFSSRELRYFAPYFFWSDAGV